MGYLVLRPIVSRIVEIGVVTLVLVGCRDPVSLRINEFGSVQVSTTTAGEMLLAPGGYAVTVDDALRRTIGINDTLTIPDVATGVREIKLDTETPDCVASAAAHDVPVLAQMVTPVMFDVTCIGAVFFEDTVEVPQTCTANLDNGTICVTGPDSDVWFQAVTATERYLTVFSSAQMLEVGTVAPGKAGCVGRALIGNRFQYAVEDLPAGTFLCVLTTAGRLSQVEIVEELCSSCDVLVIGVRTFFAFVP